MTTLAYDFWLAEGDNHSATHEHGLLESDQVIYESAVGEMLAALRKIADRWADVTGRTWNSASLHTVTAVRVVRNGNTLDTDPGDPRVVANVYRDGKTYLPPDQIRRPVQTIIAYDAACRAFGYPGGEA